MKDQFSQSHQSPALLGADPVSAPAGPCEPCDRAQIIIDRMQKGLGWSGGLPITEAMWIELKPHLRIALDTEVEAGGPYLNNGWNATDQAPVSELPDQGALIAAWTAFAPRERPRVSHWEAFQAGWKAALTPSTLDSEGLESSVAGSGGSPPAAVKSDSAEGR